MPEKTKNGGSSTAMRPYQQQTPQRRGFFSELWPDDWNDLFSMRMWPWPSLQQGQQQSPALNIYRKDNNLIVEAAMPGMKKEDINLHIDDNHLMLSGQFRQEEKEEKDHYYRSEIRRGSFHRNIPLPRGVDASQCKATYEDGMLKVTLPLKTEDPEAGRIKID